MAAPPLVLLPGMNCTADLWAGCGLDDALTPELAEPAVDGQVDRLLAQLPATFVLGGCSLGAIVAMALAVRAPHRLAGLVLVSTNAKAPTPAQHEGWRAWSRRLDEGATPAELQASILGMLLSPTASTRPELVRRTLAMGDDTGAARLGAQLRMQRTRTELLSRLGAVPAPTLVVSGADDALCPPEFHTEIASRMPAARLVTLDGGHLLPLERPREFGALVRSWLRSRVSDPRRAVRASAP